MVLLANIEYFYQGSSPSFAFNIKRINKLLFPLKSSENLLFSDDVRGNRSLLICLNWLYVKSKFGDNSLDYQLKSEGFNRKIYPGVT